MSHSSSVVKNQVQTALATASDGEVSPHCGQTAFEHQIPQIARDNYGGILGWAWTSQPQLCGPHLVRLTKQRWLTKVDDVVNHVILIVVVLFLFSMHGKKEMRQLQEGKSKKITHVCSFDFFIQQDINASFSCASCISKRMVENVCLIVIQIEKLSRIVSISGSGTEKLFFPFVPCLKRSRDCKSYLTHCRPDSIPDQIWKWNVHSSLFLYPHVFCRTTISTMYQQPCRLLWQV